MKLTYHPPKMVVGYTTPEISTSTGTPIAREYVERPAYEGPYDVIPSSSEIVLDTQYLRMTDNVRVAPIPSNYGLITWNGVTLTVS